MVFLTKLGNHACFCLEFWSSCVGRRRGGRAFKCRASQLVFYPDISFLGMIFIWIGKKPYQVGCYLYLFEILYWLVIRWLHSLGRLHRWFSCFKLNKFTVDSQGLLPERFLKDFFFFVDVFVNWQSNLECWWDEGKLILIAHLQRFRTHWL